MTSFKPNYSPKVPPPNTNTCEFGGGQGRQKHSMHISVSPFSIPSPLLKAFQLSCQGHTLTQPLLPSLFPQGGTSGIQILITGWS